MLLSHVLNDSLVVCRFVGMPSGLTFPDYSVGLTLDGAYYQGKGKTLKTAVEALAVAVDTYSPTLSARERLVDIRTPDPAQQLKALDLWQGLCNEGQLIFHDNGKVERLITVLPNGFLLVREPVTDALPPRPGSGPDSPSAAPETAPDEPGVIYSPDEPETDDDYPPAHNPADDICSLCGGPVSECGGPRQIDVDSFVCENTRPLRFFHG